MIFSSQNDYILGLISRHNVHKKYPVQSNEAITMHMPASEDKHAYNFSHVKTVQTIGA